MEISSIVVFDGVKVFSATKARERTQLGERIRRWLRDHPDNELVGKVITQSSDLEYHCIAVTLFRRTRAEGTSLPVQGGDRRLTAP